MRGPAPWQTSGCGCPCTKAVSALATTQSNTLLENSMGRIADREPCSEDEEWKHVTDAGERRRIQNRNNQRALRRRRFYLRQDNKASTRSVRTNWPVLKPKRQAQPDKRCLPSPPSKSPESEIPGDSQCDDLILRESVLRSSHFGVHEMTASNLDMESRRVFHYASTWLWPHLGQKVLDSDESVATAMSRLALSHPLTLDMFVWTAAGELEMHGSNPATQKVLLKHQIRAMHTIRDCIQSNDISDELINAINALSVMDTPSSGFRIWEDLIYGPDPSPFGDFDPPLASLGYILRFSQMKFSNQHADVAARLLRSRGGLENMAITVFAYAMQALDLVRASKSASGPSFDLCKPYRRILETQMPLYRCCGSVSSQRTYRVSDEFNLLLLDLRALLRQLHLSATSLSAEVSTETLIAWRNINQHRLLSLPHDQDQLFRLAALIFSYNVTFPVPFRTTIEELTRELVSQLCMVSTHSEDTLWAITIAALTRPDEDIQKFLREGAQKVIGALNIDTWYEFKNVLVGYLWLGEACDVGGFKFWNSICTTKDDEVDEYDALYSDIDSLTVDDFDALDIHDI